MKKPDIKKLDNFWALAVKDIAGWKCEHCGIVGMRMEAAHVVGRRHRATRWGCWISQQKYDLAGHCFCHRCHQEYDEHSPMEAEIVELTIGEWRRDVLQANAKQKVTKYQDYNVIKSYLDMVRESALV